MKYILVLLQLLWFGSHALGSCSTTRTSMPSNSGVFVNVIEGAVLGPNRHPVPNLWVELQNEFNMSIGRTQTGSSGRFTFENVASGHYFIKVYATGTDFEDQTYPVDVVNVVRNSSDTIFAEIILQYDSKKKNVDKAWVADVVFAQQVPDEAKRLYKIGVKDLKGKDFAKGASEIEEALKIFPDYYEALNTLGFTYVERAEYRRSLPYLIRSIDVNHKSFTSYYSLAYAAYKLDRLPEAAEAVKISTDLNPGSVNAQLLFGTILRLLGRDVEALPALLKAEKMSKDSPVAEVHWQLALLYDKLKRNNDAAAELESYLRIRPDAVNRKEIENTIHRLRSKTT